MEKLKAIFKKIVNKETILYIVFGVLTTLVNFVAFKLFTMVFDKLVSSQLGVHISNVLAWIFAVAFAYVTNKLFVFESKSWAQKRSRRSSQRDSSPSASRSSDSLSS